MGAGCCRGHATIRTVPVLPPALSRRLAALVAALVGAVLLSACGAAVTAAASSSATAPAASSGGAGASSGPAAKATPTTSDAVTLAPATASTGLPTMLVSALPEQGVDALRLIRDGGPFPFSKDGVTFSNREGILPAHASGWFREYTVITPGSSDRGARRIIAGRDGARFYTDDHYASFREVLSGASG